MSHYLIKHFNLFRIRRLIENVLKELNLSLSGLNVLTEAATGYYMLTSLIGALAGAEKVYALTKDSPYGNASDIRDVTMLLAEHWGVEDRIQVLFSRDADEIARADIISNLGHVRPLDKAFLKRLKKTAVIPLMYEAWEFRPQDVDLLQCHRMGIPVLATNESPHLLQIFRYVGLLALKLLLEIDVEVFRSKIVVIGGGRFGNEAVKSLRKAGAKVTQVKPEPEAFASVEVRDVLKECDALVVIEHSYRGRIIGSDGLISSRELQRLNPGLVLVHIAGNVDQQDIKECSIPHHPKKFAKAGYMSVATDYLGPRPLIDLHASGLKIGEAMARARLSGGDRLNAEEAGLRLPISQAID